MVNIHQQGEFKPQFETTIKAQEEQMDHGKVVTVRCERCEELLRVEVLNQSLWKVVCPCELYDSEFRGL